MQNNILIQNYRQKFKNFWHALGTPKGHLLGADAWLFFGHAAVWQRGRGERPPHFPLAHAAAWQRGERGSGHSGCFHAATGRLLGLSCGPILVGITTLFLDLK